MFPTDVQSKTMMALFMMGELLFAPLKAASWQNLVIFHFLPKGQYTEHYAC